MSSIEAPLRGDHESRRCLPDARVSGLQAASGPTIPLRRHLRTRRRQLLRFLAATPPSCTLVLFRRANTSRWSRFRFQDGFRIGNVFAMIVFDLDFENIEYGFRMDGPFDPAPAIASTRPRSCWTPMPVPSAAATSGARRRTGTIPSSTAAVLSSTTSTGRATGRCEIADRGPGHLRDARPRLHAASVVRRRSSPAPSPASARRSPT